MMATEAKTVFGCVKDRDKKDKQAKFQRVKINCRDARCVWKDWSSLASH